jgi:recombination protein RecT
MAQAIAKQDKDAGPITVLRAQLEQRARDFVDILPSHIKPEKFQRAALSAAQNNPDLLTADRRSFILACLKAAQDGLLPDGREAAIVAFNSRQKGPQGWATIRLAQYMPMVWGLRKKILQSGEIADLFAAVVYRQEIESGRFHYEEGSERQLRHQPILDADFAPTDADIALAYSIATFSDGTKSFEVMRRGEIDRVRQESQTGATTDKAGNPREAKGPWVDWFGEMAKKTVIRRHSKSLPQTGDILVDIEGADIAHAAQSAVALLDSRAPDRPRLIDDGDQGFDPATGEIPPPPAQGAPEPRQEPPQDQGKPDKAKPDKPPQEPPAEPQAEPEPEPPAGEPEPPPVGPGGDLDDAGQPVGDLADEAEPKTDSYGVTVSPLEDSADQYIARARACSTIVDLRALEKAAELDLAAMEPEIAAIVDSEFDKARDRLKPPPKAPPAEA